MGLPFEPESVEAMKSRLSGAFVRLWNVEEIEKSGDRPGLHREYVFDHPAGIRLIVSREESKKFDGQILHVSGSIDMKYVPQWRGKIFDQGSATAAVVGVFKDISGLTETGIAEVSMTAGGVIHLVYTLNSESGKKDASN